MIRDMLGHYPFPTLACAVLLVFTGIYGATLIATFSKAARSEHERAKSIPLEEI